MIPKLPAHEFQNTLSLIETLNLPIADETSAQQVKIDMIASILYPRKNQWEKGQAIDLVNGDTLLHWASRKKYWNLAQYLVEQGEKPLQKNDGGKTSLDLAGEISDLMKERIFRIAKEKPKNVDFKALEDLHTLINTTDIDKFNELVKKTTSQQLDAYMEVSENTGFSFLHEAARKNNGWFINWALNRGMAPVETVDAEGNTFAHILASQGQDRGPFPKISLLLNESNKEGKTVMQLLGKHNCVNMLKSIPSFEYIIQNPTYSSNGNVYYHDAAEAGSTDFLKLIWETLAKRKAHELHLKNPPYNINYSQILCFNRTNCDGQNILHIAYKANRAETVNYLLSIPGLNALLEQRDKFGKAPKDYVNLK